MSHDVSFSAGAARVRAFIRCHEPEAAQTERPDPENSERQFTELARALFALQYERVPVLRRLCARRGVTPDRVRDWRDIPAVPTTAFKEFEVTSLPPEDRPVVFHSSGTTGARPSRHFYNAESLALYEASLCAWFRPHLLTGLPAEPVRMFLLSPSPALAPHSSLVHMFDTVRRAFGTGDSFFAGTVRTDGAWVLKFDRLESAAREARAAGRPVLVLGTAFGFVQWLDHLAAHRRAGRLPAGSRIMETGGYKGRSREVPRAELHALLTKHLGVGPDHIVCEYGMSELSSQAYDRAADGAGSVEAGARCFRFPPWARAQVLSPETGREVAEGETGLIRVCDLANLRSVLVVQTEDLGVRRRDGFELVGRAAEAEARGCSLLAADPGR